MQDGYEEWLRANFLPKTASTQLSQARRLEQAYGNLDELFNRDKFDGILSDLKYSQEDKRENRPNPSKIRFESENLYEGLAHLRGALSFYARFRDSRTQHTKVSSLPIRERMPDIWLRAFYGFDPATDGYIGWTKESERNFMLDNAAPGDLCLIYGAESEETDKQNRRQVLGLLQIDLEPIRDVDKCADEGRQRKIEKEWSEKWTYALPVRRAWRIDRRIEIKHVAPITYIPEQARFMGREKAKLTPEEVKTVLQLPVTEVDVWGELPLGGRDKESAPFEQAFEPSRGVTPSFGDRESTYIDGGQKLYMMRYSGDVSAMLGRQKHEVIRKALVKIGYSNDVTERCKALNSGFPPKAEYRWEVWVTSAEYPNGKAALAAEDALKLSLAKHFESLGGEFFLGDETQLKTQFALAPSAAAFSIKIS